MKNAYLPTAGLPLERAGQTPNNNNESDARQAVR